MKGTAAEVLKAALVSTVSEPCCSMFHWLMTKVTRLFFQKNPLPSFLKLIQVGYFLCWLFILLETNQQEQQQKLTIS